jgi:hypothetical protein
LAVASSLIRATTPLTKGLVSIVVAITLLAALAWCFYKTNFGSLKQLTLYMASACIEMSNLIVYYYLHRSSHSSKAVTPTSAFLLYLALFVADYAFNVRHMITSFQIIRCFATLHVSFELVYQCYINADERCS